MPHAATSPNCSEHAWITRLPSPACTRSSGTLQGLSFAIKDNIDLAGQPTTAACPAFSRVPDNSAHVVQKLLDNGATLIGKTNLDQFACGLNGTRSPYGAVPNAFDARYISGGSSSGSAYVVATGQVDFALGTDTAGSGRVPAGLNNIVGLKPSKGLISTRGVLPAAQSVDCVSIFARTVSVAVQVLQAAAGFDPSDPFSREHTLATTPFPSRFRFGVPDQLDFFGDALSEAEFHAAIRMMEKLGGTPVTIDYAPLAGAARLLYQSALVAERYAAIRGFFDEHPRDIIEPVRSILAGGKAYSAADLCEAQIKLLEYTRQAAPMWQHIDVLLVPTAPTHYTSEHMLADPVALNRNLGEYTNFVNLLDYAAVSVPSSIRADGLPFGITLIGPCASDLQLADLGQRYHHATGLSQGALNIPLPPPAPLGGLAPPAATHLPLAVVGAHLSGMPLNSQLLDRNATLLQATTTSAHYRLFALPDTTPPKPGLQRVAEGGAAISLEVWRVPLSNVGSFLALIPSPLGLGKVELADGTWVTSFICEGYALSGATDITHHGGWRAFMASKSTA